MAQGMPYDCKQIEEELWKKLYEYDCSREIEEMGGWKIQKMQEIIDKQQWKQCQNYDKIKNKYDILLSWKKELDSLKEHPTKLEQYDEIFSQAKEKEIDSIDYVQNELKEFNAFQDWEKRVNIFYSKKAGLQQFIDLMNEKKKYSYNSSYSVQMMNIIQNTIEFSKKVQEFMKNTQEGKTTELDGQKLVQEAQKLEIQVPIAEILDLSLIHI
eukprot:TRINITY_DN758_c0_g1_i1.p3 TRINITY_DN758_c0_g1~~TRINITY_DN758_c0_g1_i1.p3  ORF type:complete len:212 (-),score=45.39 TRINITY_DN758_c0_g1_i1:170-805(-)